MNIDDMIALAECLSECYDDNRFALDTSLSGVFRRVILEGGYAFKAITLAREAFVNRAEWDFYTMTTDEVRDMLAKPVYISRNGKVIVMEQLGPKDSHRVLVEFRTQLDYLTTSLYGFRIADLHDGNWGKRKDGKNVALDYGSVEYTAREWFHKRMAMECLNKGIGKPDFPVYHKDIMGEMLIRRHEDRVNGTVSI